MLKNKGGTVSPEDVPYIEEAEGLLRDRKKLEEKGVDAIATCYSDPVKVEDDIFYISSKQEKSLEVYFSSSSLRHVKADDELVGDLSGFLYKLLDRGVLDHLKLCDFENAFLQLNDEQLTELRRALLQKRMKLKVEFNRKDTITVDYNSGIDAPFFEMLHCGTDEFLDERFPGLSREEKVTVRSALVGWAVEKNRYRSSSTPRFLSDIMGYTEPGSAVDCIEKTIESFEVTHEPVDEQVLK